jgi:AbrB family looped-hinge helix DNA binding protein
MEIGITRMSSKGQIVIPIEMRNKIKEGEKLIVFSSGGNIILKKASKMDEQLQEDLEFARRTEEALKRIDAGEYVEVGQENLFEEMDKW